MKKKKKKIKKSKPLPHIRLGNDPILQTICSEVKIGEDVSHIIKDMMYVLIDKKGVGISANQVGYAKRIIIIRSYGTFVVMMNPEILNKYGSIGGEEGCLSYPKVYKWINRAKVIRVNYLPERGCGVMPKHINLPARIIQHEIDHINGICRVGE